MSATLELLIKGKDEVSGTLSGIGKQADGLGSKLGLLAGAAIGAVGAFAGFKAIQGAVDTTQELGDAVAKLTRETGLSSEEASRLLFAFKHFGVGADDASRSLGIFAKHLKGVQDAEEGSTESADAAQAKIDQYRRKIEELNASLTTKKTPEQIQKITDEIANLNDKITLAAEAPSAKGFAKILADIGIQATDASGNILPLSQILVPLSEKFKNMPPGLEKTALAMQLFGRSGKDMIPVLNAGGAALTALGEESDKLGLTLSGEQLAKVKEYTLAQRDFGEALDGIKMQIGLYLMPKLTELAKWFTEHQPQIRAFIDNVLVKMDDVIRNKLVPALEDHILPALQDTWRLLNEHAIPALRDLATALQGVYDKAQMLSPAVDALRSAFEALPKPVRDTVGEIEGFALLTGIMVGLVAAIAGPTAAFYTLAGAVGAVGAVLVYVIEPLSSWIELLAVLSFALDQMGISYDTQFNIARDAVTTFVNVASAVIGTLIDVFNGVTGTVGTFVQILDVLAAIYAPKLGGAIQDYIFTPFDDAKNAVQWLIDRIYQLIEAIGRIPSPGDIFGGIGDVIGIHQMGGVVRRPFQLVGERGPELARLPVGTRIFDAVQTRGMLATAPVAAGDWGDIHMHIENINLGKDVTRADVRDLTKMIRSELRDLAHRGG